MMNVISTDNLCKSYGTHEVLKDVKFSVGEKKLVGFLGPNGAGKTTTIRILLGLLAASSGEATIFGQCCRRNGKSIREDIGYLPGDVHLYANMSGMATLKHFARVRKRNCDAEIKRLADRFELPLNRTVRKYSTGMRQKLGLIQALMHRPQLLVLDEPTSALDPLVRTIVFEELREVVDGGRTVLFSSHSLNEVEELCDEVIILRDGRVVEQQQIEVLRQRALRRVTIEFPESAPHDDQVPRAMQIIERNHSVLVCTWSGKMDDLLTWIQGTHVSDLIIERPDLNDLFLTYYSGKARKPALSLGDGKDV